MNEIRIFALLRIKPGQMAAFSQLANGLTEITRQKDTDTLVYHYSFDEASDTIALHEHYSSNDGFLAHMQNVASISGSFVDIGDVIHLHIAGPVNEQVKAMMQGFNSGNAKKCTFYKHLATA